MIHPCTLHLTVVKICGDLCHLATLLLECAALFHARNNKQREPECLICKQMTLMNWFFLMNHYKSFTKLPQTH